MLATGSLRPIYKIKNNSVKNHDYDDDDDNKGGGDGMIIKIIVIFW